MLSRNRCLSTSLLATSTGVALAATSAMPLLASPVVCRSRLEAPPSIDPGMAPVEVATCAAVEST